MTTVDVDAYLDRIGWAGSREPTRSTLAGLLSAHMLAIPFENLDVLLGRPVRLDIDSVQGKLVSARRGGYCFEHGTLLAAVLEHLGFEVGRHSARVTLFQPRTESVRGHMFLTVKLGSEGTFVLDPGFGGLAAPFPVPLVDGTGMGEATHGMVRDGDFWILRAKTADGTTDLWASTLEVDNAVDFEMANHYTQSHPASPFTGNMMLRALTAQGRVSVMNRALTIASEDPPRTIEIADRAALRSILREHFGFDLPEVEQMRVPAVSQWD